MKWQQKIKFHLLLLSFSVMTICCSFKLPPGKYNTTSGPTFANSQFTFTEDGRFTYALSTDDGRPTSGHGGYIVLGNRLFMLFENTKKVKSGFNVNHISCTQKDSQTVNFKVTNTLGKPIIGVAIYNKKNENEYTFTNKSGEARFVAPLLDTTRNIIITYLMLETMEIEIPGNTCMEIEVVLNENITN